jgi:hypothetical protein
VPGYPGVQITLGTPEKVELTKESISITKKKAIRSSGAFVVERAPAMLCLAPGTTPLGSKQTASAIASSEHGILVGVAETPAILSDRSGHQLAFRVG